MPDLSLATADGTDLLHLTDPTSPVYVIAGLKGLDLPIPQVFSDIQPSLPGELIRSSRDTSREVFLPLLIAGTGTSDVAAARTRLFTMLRSGPRLTVTSPAGGGDRYLDLIYISGAEGDLSGDLYGRYWQALGAILRAPDVYFSATSDQSITWSGSTTATWFPIFPLTLSSSQVLSGTSVAGTTNMATAPSAEGLASLTGTGWANFGGANDAAMTLDTSRARFGTTSVRATWPTVTSGGLMGYVANSNLTVGVTYTASVWVYVPTGSPTVRIAAFGIANGTTSTLFDTWQQLSVTWVASAPNDFLTLTSQTAPTAGAQWWVDAWQIEAGSTVTNFCDGDQPGCSWDGAPRASTSTRAATFGGVPVTVAGDVRTWPVWTITGPATALTLQHLGQGVRLDMVGEISAGASVVIDTRPRQVSVADSSGTNWLPRLQPGFSLFPLDPGINQIAVSLSGTSSTSAVTVSYTPRYLAGW